MKSIMAHGGALLLIFNLACATSQITPPAQVTPSSPASSLDTALVEAQEKGWQDLELIYECRRNDYWTELWIFGNGVAIWNQDRQTQLEATKIHQVLALLQQSEFSKMAEVYGGKGTEGPPAQAGVSVRCSITFTLEGHRHSTTQLVEGYQHDPLQSLADRIFEVSYRDEPGVRAESLTDGLNKIAHGTLAVEAMTLIAHRKPEIDDPGDGWLMQLVKGAVSVRPFSAAEGYGPPIDRALSISKIQDIARKLALQRVDELPINLWSKDYREIKVRILGHETSTIARPFGGRSKPHPDQQEAQDRFSQLFDLLESLQTP